jgi:hypothetical protein
MCQVVIKNSKALDYPLILAKAYLESRDITSYIKIPELNLKLMQNGIISVSSFSGHMATYIREYQEIN